MHNPWISLWLSAANSWAGAARGIWTAELHRQQPAMANEMIRQTIDFWTRTGWRRPQATSRSVAAESRQRSSQACADRPFAPHDHADSRCGWRYG